MAGRFHAKVQTVEKPQTPSLKSLFAKKVIKGYGQRLGQVVRVMRDFTESGPPNRGWLTISLWIATRSGLGSFTTTPLR
jgi:hypothetical protein